jgi:hypothetical protein
MSTAIFLTTLQSATREEMVGQRKAFFDFLSQGLVEAVSGPLAPTQTWTVERFKSVYKAGWASMDLVFENSARITLVVEQLGTRVRFSYLIPSLAPYVVFRRAAVNERAPLMTDFERFWIRWAEDNPMHCFEYEVPTLLRSLAHQETLLMHVSDAVRRLSELALLCSLVEVEGASTECSGQTIHVGSLPRLD